MNRMEDNEWDIFRVNCASSHCQRWIGRLPRRGDCGGGSTVKGVDEETNLEGSCTADGGGAHATCLALVVCSIMSNCDLFFIERLIVLLLYRIDCR